MDLIIKAVPKDTLSMVGIYEKYFRLCDIDSSPTEMKVKFWQKEDAQILMKWAVRDATLSGYNYVNEAGGYWEVTVRFI